MEDSLMPRALCTNDSKFLHHHVPDFFTSVQVTQDIPAGVSFGPCVLHNTFYDTIAFIALKSFDRGRKSYVFRVDPDALKSSPLVVPWLRLVQAAMDAEEQNTEAYLKGGQLYFRTIQDISQGEELLVWYDEELSHLLGFSDIKARALTVGYSCGKCGQEFKHENPFLAHCRFLCAQVKADAWRGDGETRRQRSVTDFHNIARDMEHKKSSEDRKRRHDEALSPRCRKPVLLEKKNMANHNNMTHVHREYPHDHDFMAPTMKVSSSPSSKLKSAKSSAFAEIKKAKSDQPSRAEDIIRENPSVSTLQLDREAGLGLQSDSSAFLLWSAHAEQKSAFCKPSKLSITEDQQHQRPAGPSDEVSEHAALGYRNMLASHLFQGDLSSTQTVSPTAPLSAAGSFHYAPEVWCRNISGPLQPTSSLTLLPPTLSSLGVTVQNWCAKCNLSFRMTSDLVFHMRSHHKKEFAAEAQGRRRREEKLTCPICHEYFRERHHLSRHMTSHN
ncbi:PR domain zinc finger protein 8 isoform X2 [Ictalurus furcatus]|uniref:PR domain zinc finger protein 8 isoform X2 n=1 Tax=Ictalurus furcatus TaxID=66913 RepID=UPI00234FE9FB|nr:PR domain zinc finger protein 8 isoform X2 [Ictalurus furcatus]